MKLPLAKLMRHGLPSVPESFDFQARVPGLGDIPFMSLSLKLATEQIGSGEQVRLQAHIETRFSAIVQALPGAQKIQALPGARSARRLIQSGLQNRGIQKALSPFRHTRLSSWVDIQASTAPRDRGPADLLPTQELAKIGVQPHKDGPPIQTWLSETGGGAPGLAQITTVQMDKRQLPQRLREALGAAPFQLAATVVHVIEDND